MPKLFSPLTIRGTTFKNRVFISPMCQYSSVEGMPTDWHLVHLGARAVGGAACIIQEATAVSPEGRISPADAGIWNDEQALAYARINRFLASQGCRPAIQLAHAGRKASTAPPWEGGAAVSEQDGGWPVVAPSAFAFSKRHKQPHALKSAEIDWIIGSFVEAAQRSLHAGFEVAEVHSAHGYLLHEFLSPLSNFREDEYGGTFDNRIRLTMTCAKAVREIWPEQLPVFVRISASDWAEGGWDIEQSVELSQRLAAEGIDLIDVSSGGLVPGARIPVAPSYQVPFASVIRSRAGVATGAVGLIETADQAEAILQAGDADIILIGRPSLLDANWPINAANALGAEQPDWPQPYARISELPSQSRN